MPSPCLFTSVSIWTIKRQGSLITNDVLDKNETDYPSHLAHSQHNKCKVKAERDLVFPNILNLYSVTLLLPSSPTVPSSTSIYYVAHNSNTYPRVSRGQPHLHHLRHSPRQRSRSLDFPESRFSHRLNNRTLPHYRRELRLGQSLLILPHPLFLTKTLLGMQNPTLLLFWLPETRLGRGRA